jgi:hypothetical protein
MFHNNLQAQSILSPIIFFVASSKFAQRSKPTSSGLGKSKHLQLSTDWTDDLGRKDLL